MARLLVNASSVKFKPGVSLRQQQQPVPMSASTAWAATQRASEAYTQAAPLSLRLATEAVSGPGKRPRCRREAAKLHPGRQQPAAEAASKPACPPEDTP